MHTCGGFAAVRTGPKTCCRRPFWQYSGACAISRAEFSLLIPQKELYQDRFTILREGGYSGVEEMAGMTLDAHGARLHS